MTTIVQDVRQAVRVLSRHPGFTVTAIVILGVGIGVNTAIFTIFNRFMLQPLPVPDPAAIVRLSMVAADSEAERLSYPDYLDLRDRTTTIRDLIGSTSEIVNMGANAGASGGAAADASAGTPPGRGPDSRLDSPSGPQFDPRRGQIRGGGLVPAKFVSGNYASALGGRALIGRTLTPADDRPDADVVVLGYTLWQRAFDRDPRVLGQTLTLNGHAVTIVGVMARGFNGLAPEPTGLWLPIAAHPRFTGDPERARRRDARWVDVTGRLAPGATASRAQAELSAIADSLARPYPDSAAPHAPADAARTRIVVSPGARATPMLRGGERLFPILVTTATGLVLAIACANLAGVLIARWVSRQRELGVRLALGASRRRLIRQLLTESALLACAGGAVGLVLAFWIAPVIVLLATPGDRQLWTPELGPDMSVFVFSLLLSGIASLLFGVLPALHATRVDPLVTLNQGVTLFGHQIRRARLLNSLVAVQMAFALMLLVSAALLVRGMVRVSAVDPGFDVGRVLSVELVFAPAADAAAAPSPAPSAAPSAALGGAQTEALSAARTAARATAQASATSGQVLLAQAADALRRLPGVTSVAMASLAPLGASSATLLWRDSQRRPWFEIPTNEVSANFFDTLGIRLIRGRAFTDDDIRSDAPVVIVNDALARRLWPGRDPIGQEIVFPPAYESRATVIGVTRDARTANLSDLVPMNMYTPLVMRDRTRVSLVARTAGPPQTLLLATDLALRRVSARLVIDHVDTGASNVERWIRPARLASALSASLGGLALLLTLVGVYGVVSFAVGQRTRELAIRIALGAARGDILGLVLRQALVPIVIGVAAGWLGLSSLTPLFGAMLHGLSPFDPTTFVSVSAAVVGATLLAICVPARAAARLDPVANLRRE